MNEFKEIEASKVEENDIIKDKHGTYSVISITEGESNVVLTCHHFPKQEGKGAILLTRGKDELIKVFQNNKKERKLQSYL